MPLVRDSNQVEVSREMLEMQMRVAKKEMLAAMGKREMLEMLARVAKGKYG